MEDERQGKEQEVAGDPTASGAMTRYVVTDMTNFMRIFRLPLQYPKGFCFGGGYSVEMQLVDWFNPFSQPDFWDGKRKELTEVGMEEHRNLLRDFIKGKVYVKQFPGHTFLAIADYGDAFLITT